MLGSKSKGYGRIVLGGRELNKLRSKNGRVFTLPKSLILITCRYIGVTEKLKLKTMFSIRT